MRRSLILVLALVAGVATLVLLQLALPKSTEVAEVKPQSETAFVLVYSRDLPRGTRLDKGNMHWQQQLVSALADGAITAEGVDAAIPADLDGKLLRRDVLDGEAVRPEFLVEGAAGFMSLALAPGMRAVGIAVTDQKLAGGFILPDDRVDLIHTATGDFDGDGVANSFSQTILENIRVLAVGERTTERVTLKTADQQASAAETQSDMVAKGETVTLEMSDEQAHLLFSAEASGQISLALRALEDQGPSRIVSSVGVERAVPPVEPAQKPAASAAPAPTAPAPTAPAPEPAAQIPAAQTSVTQPPRSPKSASVRVIVGSQTSVVEVPFATAQTGGAQP